MEGDKSNKIERVLAIYTKLLNGGTVIKAEEAKRYGVDERSIQRDINDIRHHFDSDLVTSGIENHVVYDYSAKGYRLEHIDKMKLTNSEILAICKILLDSRAFPKKEMKTMLDKLVNCSVPKVNQSIVKELISNEEYYYVELQNKKSFLDKMWDIGNAIKNCQYIEMSYYRVKDKKTVMRKVKPVAIMFSEYYFYLTAFIENKEVQKNFDVINDPFPTIYRIDRIEKMKLLDEKFRIPYTSRFEEGEFRKKIQFMIGGKQKKVKFKFSGYDIDSILDRLPTAEIISEEEGVYTITAEVFGNGIDMWLRSQGELVEVL